MVDKKRSYKATMFVNCTNCNKSLGTIMRFEKIICRHCGEWVFTNKKEKFKHQLKMLGVMKYEKFV